MENQNAVFAANPANFQADVIDRSKQIPVVVLFWAAQVGPSNEARSTLERLVAQHPGKVALALVDVAEDQSLAQHLRVQALPSLRVVRDGQLVDQLEGPQDSAALTQLIESLTLSPADVLRAQLQLLLDKGDLDAALGLLQQSVNEEPNNMSFRVELADVLVQQRKLDDARQVLAGITEGTEELERPQTRLELIEEAQLLEDQPTLEAACEAAADDLELHYQLAVVAAANGDAETALEHAMLILQQDREFRDDIGRLTMLRIFNVLGKGSPLTSSYRRRMFNFMH